MLTLSVAHSTWAYGTPTSGPGAAHSGVNVWATNLEGAYINYEDGRLTSPLLDLRPYAGSTIQLKWWEWLQTERGYDFGRVEVSADDGATWRQVYSGTGAASPQWTERSIFLTPAEATATVRLRFHFVADYINHSSRLVCGRRGTGGSPLQQPG